MVKNHEKKCHKIGVTDSNSNTNVSIIYIALKHMYPGTCT